MLSVVHKKCFCLILVLLLAGCGNRNMAPVAELKWQPYSRSQKTHTVLRGETLYAIAFRYDTDYRQLAIHNRLRPPYALRVGQVLNVQGVARKQLYRPTAYKNPGYQAKPYQPRPVAQQPRVIYSPKINSRSSSGWLWPINGRVVTSFIPEQGKKGINIASKKGEKVHAATNGVVAYAGSGLAGYGNLIIIKHNNEYLTAYGHNSKNLVKEGQSVRAGQVIAEVGVIDRQYWGVHFEIRKSGTPVNPLNYLKKG